MKNLSDFPFEVAWAILALSGGVARYLTKVANGSPFRLRALIPATLVAGFSGYMFAIFGRSLALPSDILYVAAGTGGFMGEQAMRLLVEWVQTKMSSKHE